MNSTNKLLEKELSYKLQGFFYNVANKYRSGFKEKIYQNALAEEIEKAKIGFHQQKRIVIHSIDKDKEWGVYIPDFVVENKIIVKIKAQEFITKNNEDQQKSYLKASKYEIGYLVNYGVSPLYVKSFIYTNDRKKCV